MRSLQNQIGWCTRLQRVMAVTITSALLAFYLFGYRPSVRRLDATQFQLKTKKRELDENQGKARNLTVLVQQVGDLQTKVEKYDRQFPKQPDLDLFIKDITEISQHLALAEWKYQPGTPKRTENYFELPIQMHFEGDCVSAAAFVREVEELKRLTRVGKLNLKSKDSRTGLVEVEVALNIYFSEGQ